MKNLLVGVDIGSTNIKIVAFSNNKEIIGTQLFRTNTRVKQTTEELIAQFATIFLAKHGLEIDSVGRFVLTGVGASFIETDIAGIPTFKVDELQALGFGGLYLSGVQKAIVVSLGTGSAFVKADGDSFVHIGGSGIGAATLEGLSMLILNQRDPDILSDFASSGNLANVDLIMADVSKDTLSFLPMDATAAHFGKLSAETPPQDIARSIINMIFQTIALFAVFLGRSMGITDIVLTGGLTTMEQAKKDFGAVGGLYGFNFIIPEHAVFATAIGACMSNL